MAANADSCYSYLSSCLFNSSCSSMCPPCCCSNYYYDQQRGPHFDNYYYNTNITDEEDAHHVDPAAAAHKDDMNVESRFWCRFQQPRQSVLHNGISLFQDLKLKRRKVDSRCSSDGESIGTSDSTASLSPDAQTQNGEGSPKNKERCVSPEDLIRTGNPTVAKLGKTGCNGFVNGTSSASSLMFMMKADRATSASATTNNSNNNAVSSKLNFINNLHHQNQNQSQQQQHQNAVVAASSTPNKIETARNGVIKLTNGESIGDNSTKVVLPISNGEASLPVENGFSTKKSRASSLEKITEEEMTTATADEQQELQQRDNNNKSPLRISSSSPLTSTSPLSSAGSGHSNPPSPTAPASGSSATVASQPAITSPQTTCIKTEKEPESKMEIGDDEGHDESAAGRRVDDGEKHTSDNEPVKIKRERESSPQPAEKIILVGADRRKFSSMSLSPPHHHHQLTSSPPSSNGSSIHARTRDLLAVRSPGKMSNHSSRSSSPPSFLAEKYGRGGLIGNNGEGGGGGGGGDGGGNSRSSPPNSVKSNNSGSRVPSPQDLHNLRQSSPILHQLSPQQQHMLLSQQSQLHARLLNGPPPSSSSQQHHHHLQHLQHMDGRGGGGNRMDSSPSALVHAELRNLAEKPDPLSVITPTSLSFHHHSMYRINGVRPEVISGGAVTPTTNPPSGHHLGGGNGGSGSSNNSINSGGGNGSNNNNSTRKSPSLNRSPNSSPRSNASSGSSAGSSSTNNTHMSNGSMSHLHNHSPPNHVQQQQQNLMNAVAGNLAMINSLSAMGQSAAAGANNASSNNGSGHNHVNLNRTPTVIMGEAGGVRTMLWSQPGATVSPDQNSQGGSPTVNGHHYGIPSPHHTHSPHLTNGHSNSLSPPHHMNNSSNNASGGGGGGGGPLTSISAHLKGGLSMERLWASEAALNLSTSNSNNISNGYGTSNNSNSNSNNSNGPNNFGRHGSDGGGGGLGSSTSTLGSSNSGGGGVGSHGGASLINGHHNHSSGSLSSGIGSSMSLHPDDEDFEQPMICMICEDRATGLHYGIITCEGCKGFFKRTVQNRRVYTCVADGTCEITKAQRNRCQYCRFKKCIEQGMVLQAVREDRMPGGRNSGAVYNLYKVPVKYRKHKKGNRGAGGKLDKNSSNNSNGSNSNNNNNILGSNNNSNSSSSGLIPSPGPAPSPQSNLGTILKAALTSPNDINHLRPTAIPFNQAAEMITNLVQCDNFHDIAALHNWEDLLEGGGDLSEKLCQMGDSIVYRLVQWTKRLPFYQEVPVDVHTKILTHKWHELLVLTTSAWQAMYTPGPTTNRTIEEESMDNLRVLQRCLEGMMGRSLTLEQLRQDVGQMVERLTYLTRSFRRLGIRKEEYVTLKVIAMLQSATKSNEVGAIQERYIKCLGTFLEATCPSHTNRLTDLLRTLPEVREAASLLLESKMFYVPFLLNSALQR